MINQNETVQKVSAAVESEHHAGRARPQPRSAARCCRAQDVFLPLDDLYDAIGEAQGGWFPAVDAATDTTASRRRPHRRARSASAATCSCAATTCSSRPASPRRRRPGRSSSQQAAAVNKPPVSGLGLALSNVGDGNVQVARACSPIGGRIADDAGKTVTIKSDATRAYLRWVKDAWDKRRLPAGQRDLGRRRRQPGLPRPDRRRSSPTPARSASPPRTRIRSSSRRPPTRRCRRARRASSRRSTPQLRAIPKTAQNPDAAQGADRAPGAAGVHAATTSRSRSTARCCRTRPSFAAFDGIEPDPRGPARARPERHGAGLSGRLQHRLRRRLQQLHRAEDGAARRHRRLGLRPGDGRGADARRRRSTTSTSRPPEAPAPRRAAPSGGTHAAHGRRRRGACSRRARAAASALRLRPGRCRSLALILGLVAYPFLYAIYVSFTDRVVGGGGDWIGLDNFRYLARLGDLRRARSATRSLIVVVTDVLKLADRARAWRCSSTSTCRAAASSARS